MSAHFDHEPIRLSSGVAGPRHMPTAVMRRPERREPAGGVGVLYVYLLAASMGAAAAATLIWMAEPGAFSPLHAPRAAILVSSGGDSDGAPSTLSASETVPATETPHAPLAGDDTEVARPGPVAPRVRLLPEVVAEPVIVDLSGSSSSAAGGDEPDLLAPVIARPGGRIVMPLAQR